MKLYVSALLFVPLLALVNAQPGPCNVETAIRNLVSQYNTVPNMDCTTVTTRTADATCPTGYLATGCSCGKSCGSWNLVGKSQCHCQCQNMDWATAVCCRNQKS